jgi:hypothetical protein
MAGIRLNCGVKTNFEISFFLKRVEKIDLENGMQLIITSLRYQVTCDLLVYQSKKQWKNLLLTGQAGLDSMFK